MTNGTHYARKRFGQNFLHDHSVIANILANLQIKSDEHWVEIGPGQGALTAPLLDKNITLDVVELDRDLVGLLRTKFKDKPNLTIHSADALKFEFAKLAKPDEKLHIVGNLPYNISTPLLFHLLDNAGSIAAMYFMLQKEVVDRICAVPGSKKYGRLSVMMQYHCTAECLFDVYPESFDPAPKVMSAIIKLIPHPTPPVLVNDKAVFKQLVTQAFSQRRKTLRNSLKTLVSEKGFVSLGIDPNARAETISLLDFANLSNALSDDER
ncbi:ribosomal RNA small subunit methyltransferase A [Methyloglobulus morosus KoM1]|uniref:Ribosomal RNA small subunit methyltransferase A n=1 Tax=Methyloglobulus morosus KoM1 TaxID=1116472 RepID=V5C8K8_9GAMM|nr:16S rRNA (adenine(1518)-N(6)/adenine(1519)-N(6))-dimethyltransferase RsmA [Methyloglobulus morosus]ESS73033.1 ribosomal RNA small subunit methyltransferase A [Methyloglobulus morosus KoM1]